LDEARARALAVLAEVRAGRDPRNPSASEPGGAAWTIGRAFEAYVADLEKRPGTELSRRDMTARLTRYLEDWRALPLASLTKEMVERRQADVAKAIKAAARQRNATGARTANAVVRDLGAVWEFARDYTPLPALAPTRKITMIGEVRAHREIPIAELGVWWASVGAIRNPLRVAMHRLGLLSGLRPGNLVAIERAWLGDRRITFPAHVMKGRREFVLPLSGAMLALVSDATDAGRALYRDEAGRRWLFPTRGKNGDVGHTIVTHEKALTTGHALRHTWKTCARLARVPESTIEILMAHRLGGVRDTYGSLEDQFDMLLEAQEQVTAFILGRVG
jgi:integrase